MQYWRLQNADGKHWIIPTKNVSTALGIYQPSYWKGKLLKRVLPLFGVFAKFYSPFTLVDIPLDNNIIKCLEGVFPGHKLEYSVFLGTPSVHQKTVIQIYEGHNILGYAKVSEKECVKQLFDHEEIMLKELKEIGIKNIPQCLFNEKLDENQQLFVMTTEKNEKSVAIHSWSKWHEIFIEDLERKTHKKILFEGSDYARMMQNLSCRTNCLPPEQAAVVLNSIKRIKKEHFGKYYDMAVMHGDFTPWNMFVQDNHLFVFDWEYAKRTCPMGLDKCHFFVQSAIFEKHLSAKQIIQLFENGQNEVLDNGILEMYLIAIIATYVCREENENISTNISAYIVLLKLIS